MDIKQEALKLHKEHRGKIEVVGKVQIKDMHDLALVYTPGVAEPCLKINQNVEDAYIYTTKGNNVAVVSDGTAVLGLGDIGPEAAIPVMEGKSALFKYFGGVDAFPICLDTKDVDKIVQAVTLIAPVFGGINLEDISAPRCFEIERRLKERLDIPVFHDDQHGSAVVVLSAIINALKLVNKKMEEIKIVVGGAGASSIAVARFMLSAGAQNVILCDSMGIVYEGRTENMNFAKEDVAKITNREKLQGSWADALVGADIFVGLSGPKLVTTEMVRTMAPDPIVIAMANPIPEILPDEAKAGGARIVATGRSDYPNQVNNCLGFPGIFKGALRVRARDINEEMKLAAAYAIAATIPDNELSETNFIPNIFHPEVMDREADAVAQAARDSGVARI